MLLRRKRNEYTRIHPRCYRGELNPIKDAHKVYFQHVCSTSHEALISVVIYKLPIYEGIFDRGLHDV